MKKFTIMETRKMKKCDIEKEPGAGGYRGDRNGTG